MKHDSNIKDMNGKTLELGHIVCVRYAWNSYAGVIRMGGLSLYEFADRFKGAARLHPLEKGKGTYQVLGHTDTTHPDYDKGIVKWINSEKMECPVKIRVYDGLEAENKKLSKQLKK